AFKLFVLPVPVFVPVPEYYNPPEYVAAPPPNVIYNNIHNTVVINSTTNTVTITNSRGQTQTVTPAQALAPQPVSSGQSKWRIDPTAPAPPPGVAPTAPAPSSGASTAPSRTPVAPGATGAGGAAAVAAGLAPSLPPSFAQKATKIHSQSPTTAPGLQPMPSAQRPGQPLAPGQT